MLLAANRKSRAYHKAPVEFNLGTRLAQSLYKAIFHPRSH
jgi:hypothetical protein